jgi:hypothetical protein
MAMDAPRQDGPNMFTTTNGDTFTFEKIGDVLDIEVTGSRGGVKSFTSLSRHQTDALRRFLTTTT